MPRNTQPIKTEYEETENPNRPLINIETKLVIKRTTKGYLSGDGKGKGEKGDRD